MCGAVYDADNRDIKNNLIYGLSHLIDTKWCIHGTYRLLPKIRTVFLVLNDFYWSSVLRKNKYLPIG